MFYPPEIVQEVRALNDIVDVVGGYVALRMRGGQHWGLCPFHTENTPSFTVNGDTQFFHCFGCGAGGNALTFVMRIEHLDFVDALKLLADRVHFTLPTAGDSKAQAAKHAERNRMAELNKQAARFFYDYLQTDTPEAAAAREYLHNRGVPQKVQAIFGIGLSPDSWDGLHTHLKEAAPDTTPAQLHKAGLLAHSRDKNRYYDRFRGRLIFPIIAPDKRVVGFGGRIMRDSENEAKYLNSPETDLFNKSAQLYALNLARKTRAKEFIIVEGYMDVLALYTAGFANVVGVLGTALTARHVQALRRAGCETALLLLDSDRAGTAAAVKSIPLLIDGGLRVKVLQVPDAKDPDEYLQKFGAAQLGALLREAKGHVSFQIAQEYKQHDMAQTDERVTFTQKVAALIAPLRSEIETDAYVHETAHISNIAASAIFEEIKKLRATAAQRGEHFIQPRMRTQRTDDPGLRAARKTILYLALTQADAACALQSFLPPNEIGDALHEKMLQTAYALSQRALPAPADIVSLFETTDEQQQAADIFTKPITYATPQDMEKSLNEMVLLIKRAYIDSQIDHFGAQNDLETVNNLLNHKKTLQNQYITLPNG